MPQEGEEMTSYYTPEDLAKIPSVMSEQGIDKYEVKGGVVYVDGVDIGSVSYLASRRTSEQVAGSVQAALGKKEISE